MSNTMIPSNPSKTSVRRYVANIVKTYHTATADQRIRGAQWYVTAHELAGIIADGDFRKGAGVIAALSANKSWPENQKLATRALVTGTPSGHVGNAIEKATRILNGEDPEKVLPMDAKTGNFFLCIADPNHPTAVCVDRHAHDVAIGRRFGNDDRGLSSKGRYNALADAYRIAARKLELSPATLQAITWVVQIESIRRTDAYGYGASV